MYSADADGFYSEVETDGMIDNDESVYFEMIDENPSTEIGMYTADFTVNSMAEMDGSANFSNNISSREFMISEDFQSVIPSTNIMYPVTKINNLPEAFNNLKIPKVLHLDPKEINEKKEDWINEWLNAS